MPVIPPRCAATPPGEGSPHCLLQNKTHFRSVTVKSRDARRGAESVKPPRVPPPWPDKPTRHAGMEMPAMRNDGHGASVARSKDRRAGAGRPSGPDLQNTTPEPSRAGLAVSGMYVTRDTARLRRRAPIVALCMSRGRPRPPEGRCPTLGCPPFRRAPTPASPARVPDPGSRRSPEPDRAPIRPAPPAARRRPASRCRCRRPSPARPGRRGCLPA